MSPNDTQDRIHERMPVLTAEGRHGWEDCADNANRTTMSQTTYEMRWRDRKNPDNQGTGLPITDGKEAAAICREHNRLYPRYTHWAERIDPQQTTEQ